jgi:hypothetical protein
MHRILGLGATVAALVLTTGLATAYQAQAIESIWVGNDATGNTISIHISGETAFFSDAAGTVLGTWALKDARIRVKVLAVLDRRGKLQTPPGATPWTLTGRFAKAGRICLTSGGPRPLLTPKTGAEHCWSANQVATGHGACVEHCVRANQMRAVGPDEIESDCRAICQPTR